MNVGLFGIGAIGSVIAIELNKNSALKCFYFNRSEKNIIKVWANGNLAELAIQQSIPDQFKTKLDWLIICIKANHFQNAQSDLKKLISPKTRIAVVRNGLNLKEPLLHFSNSSNILECIIDCSCQPIGNSIYERLKSPTITSHQSNILNEFQSLFATSELIINTSLDFKTTAWKKVCESAALGSILCLSGSTAWIFKDLEIRGLYIKILEEARNVAKADGANIKDSFKDTMLNKLDQYPGQKGSSMLTDRLLGRPIELEAKNKIISDLGKQHNIETPINDLICTLLKHTNVERNPLENYS